MRLNRVVAGVLVVVSLLGSGCGSSHGGPVPLSRVGLFASRDGQGPAPTSGPGSLTSPSKMASEPVVEIEGLSDPTQWVQRARGAAGGERGARSRRPTKRQRDS
jgi:hypothetical protein